MISLLTCMWLFRNMSSCDVQKLRLLGPLSCMCSSISDISDNPWAWGIRGHKFDPLTLQAYG